MAASTSASNVIVLCGLFRCCVIELLRLTLHHYVSASVPPAKHCASSCPMTGEHATRQGKRGSQHEGAADAP
jgi:hypothetical protein